MKKKSNKNLNNLENLEQNQIDKNDNKEILNKDILNKDKKESSITITENYDDLENSLDISDSPFEDIEDIDEFHFDEDVKDLDIKNLDVEDLDEEKSAVENLDIENLDIENSEVENLDIENLNEKDLAVENLDIENLDSNIENLDIDIENLDSENLDSENSEVENLDIENLNTENLESQETANEEVKGKKKHKKFFVLKVVSGTLVACVGILGIAYVIKAQTFRKKFFPNTYINDIDAGYKTPEEIEEIIRDEISKYSINIKSRDNKDEIFKGADVGLHYVADSSIEDILKNQKILSWYEHTKENTEYSVNTAAELDEDKFESQVMTLDALNSEKFTAPEDAKISEYSKEEGYKIIPEVQGNTVDVDKTKAFIKDSMLTLKNEINLDTPDTDLYAKPNIYSNNEDLKNRTATLNKYAAANIKYSKGMTLDGSTISGWLKIADDGNVVLEDDKIKEYVKNTIAEKYDTAYKPKKLKATGGGIVTIEGGSYGWKVDQNKEYGKIKELIMAGSTTQRDPEFSKRAASLGEYDYGDSYVEVNLAAQKAYLYKNGNLVISTDFVSGNVSRGWATPAGVYALSYKQRNATLKGEGYATPVQYWMPFNRGIGFHDAPWRGVFGGNIYRTGGSHGCINLPPAVAKVFFDNLSAGYPVLCHFGGGRAEKPVAAAPQETTSPQPETTVVETVAPDGTPGATKESSAETSAETQAESTETAAQMTPSS